MSERDDRPAQPSQFYVASPDDTCLDYMTDDSYLCRKIPGMRDQFRAIRSLQDRYWDMRKVTNHGSVIGGDGGMKHVASIPKDVALAAEVLEPDIFKDQRKFYAWLDRNPQYATRKHG